MKKLFNNIPQGRALIYLILLCLLPAFLAALYIYSGLSDVDETERQIAYIQEKASIQEKREATNRTIRANFKEPDHFYIDKNLETLIFLEPEIDVLQKIVQQKNFPDDEAIKKRLEFLTSNGNTLSFAEGVVQRLGPIQETIETQAHPVEVDLKDISKILARIEGIDFRGEKPAEGRPQLLILDFKIEKKKSNDKNEVFLLNMKLLKREFS